VTWETEYINDGKKPASKTRQRNLETVGDRSTGRDVHTPYGVRVLR
jgi:hypothetical protein